jgi:small subunit ribosomal protein S18
MPRNKRRGAKEAARKPGKRKVCIFCKENIAWVDYKDVNLLRKFMSDRAKIRARRVTGNCAQHQRDVAAAIKTARELALLPYTQRTMTESRAARAAAERAEPAEAAAAAAEESGELEATEEAAEEAAEEEATGAAR